MHAVIEVAGPGDITLIDLGNQPRTLVNGAPVDKCKLHVGDQIAVGTTKIVLTKAEAKAVHVAAVSPVAFNPFSAASDGPFASNPSANPFVDRRGFAPGGSNYEMVRSGPSVPREECELTHVPAVDVSISWGTNTLFTKTLNPPRDFYVGEECGKNTGCDFFLPSEVLGTTRMPVLVTSQGSTSVVIPAGATGTIEIPKRGRFAVADALRSATPCPELSGAYQLALAPGSTAHIEVGDFTFRVNVGNAGKPLGAAFDPRGLMETLPYVLVAALFIGGILLMGLYSVPPANLAADDGVERDMVAMIQEYLDVDAMTELEDEEPELETEEEVADSEGGTGTAAKGADGTLGDTSAAEANDRYAVKGSAEDVKLARERLLRDAATFGIIGVLNANSAGEPAGPVAPWGSEVAIGDQERAATGNMWGERIGESFDSVGLGLTSWGEGGGGLGEGIGLGQIGTISHGAGRGPGDGIGDGHGFRHTRPGRKVGSPTMRPGTTKVLGGRLPAETIRRIVRQNHGSFRSCYEQGLGRNPSLEGRVSARFMIDRDGSVSNVANGGSDLPDSQVVDCVLRVYYRLSFPAPEGGVVSVTYPLNFQPD